MTWPKNNADWWRAKISANQDRDQRSAATLTARGWRVVRIWEHEDPEHAADRIEAAVRQARR
jgi:DNA mismatch endonuclease (patch repair protein)